MKRQGVQLVPHLRAGPRQKTRPHAIGRVAEAEVHTRRLDLPLNRRRFDGDHATVQQLKDLLGGKDAIVVRGGGV